jgi:CBS domain-containing protein
VKAKVGEAAKMMLQNNFSGLPITDGDKLVGIVTKTDLAKLI